MPNLNIDQLVDKYIRIRDKKAEVQKTQKAELARFDEALHTIERVFLTFMQENNVDSLNTNHGTAYKRVQTSCTIADRDAFLNFVREGDNWAFAD